MTRSSCCIERMGLVELVGIVDRPFAVVGQPFVVAVGLVVGPHHRDLMIHFPSWL